MKEWKRIRFVSLFVVALLAPTAICFGAVKTEADLKAFLDTKEVVYEDICVQMGVANWNVYTEEGSPDQDTPKSRYYELFNEEELNRVIDVWFEKRESIQDPVLKRRIEVWKNVLTGAKVDMDEKIYTLENKLEALLALSADSVERPAAEKLDKQILTLMKMRNEKAKFLGYGNYAEMILEITGLGSEWFYSFIDTVDSMTRDCCLKYLIEYKKENQIEEFTIQDFRRLIGQYYRTTRGVQNMEIAVSDLMQETVNNIGFDYDSMPVRFVEKQIPYGGNGLAIQIPDDFRIVILPNAGLSTWMHELGHGLQGMFTRIAHPILKGYEWCIGSGSNVYSEGMAETSARFISNPKWLKQYYGLTDEDIANRNKNIRKYIPFYIRGWMIGLMFEIELYKNLDQDIVALRNRIGKHYSLTDYTDNSDYRLSSSIMFVSYPVYLQNYLIADFISWQVHQALEEKFGENYVFNKKVADFMIKHLYYNGELYHWQDRLKEATGKKLDVKGYLEYFGM